MKIIKIYFLAIFSIALSYAMPMGVMNGAPDAGAATGGAIPEASTTNVNHNYSAVDSKTADSISNKVFDVNKDSINFEDGTFNWKGKTFNMGNSKLVKARFERYLSTQVSSSNLEDYMAIVSEITSTLSPLNSNCNDEQLEYAWKRLYDAAEYDFDANMSLIVANNVFAAFRMKKEYYEMRHNVLVSQTEEKKAKEYHLSKERMSVYANERLANTLTKKQIGLYSKINPNSATADVAEATKDYALKTAQVGATTALKELNAAQAIIKYQTQIVTFLLSRKFQHAQLSAAFYRQIYRENSAELKVGKEEVASLFPVSNAIPTNDSLESIATEALFDVKKGMESVEYLYASGQRYNALMRLMETFILGEFDPVMLAFAFEKRSELLKIYRELSVLQRVADAKDYTAVEKSLEKLQLLCNDFPYQEVLSNVQAAQRASNLKVLAAKQAVALGNVESVEKHLTEAAKIWPLNPNLESFSTQLVDVATGKTKYLTKFDDFYERGNNREIMNEASEFAFALSQDKERSQKLKEVVSRLTQVDMLIAQAEELQAQNNPYLAWEMLESAKKIDNTDPILARAIGNLSPYVADYVMVLNRASNAEKEGNWAVALNNYLAAQKILPTSKTCRMGIERCAKKYMQ